jgi:hypothetical protein
MWHDAWKLQSAHLLGGASLARSLWQHGRHCCWTADCWNTFPQQQIWLKKQCIAYRVMSVPRQRIKKRFHSHGNEPPKHSNIKDAITLLLKKVISIRFDQNLPQGENWPTEEVRSEIFIVHGVVTVTFRVLSLFVVTKCYSYSKIVKVKVKLSLCLSN